MTEEVYKAQFRETAREQVKGSLLLDAIADKEKIEVSEEDIASEIGMIAAQSGQDPSKVANLYHSNQRAKENLALQMRENKAIAFLVENAKVTEVPKEEIKN